MRSRTAVVIGLVATAMVSAVAQTKPDAAAVEADRSAYPPLTDVHGLLTTKDAKDAKIAKSFTEGV